MTRVFISLNDLTDDKRDEIVQEVESVDGDLEGNHEIWIYCDITEDGIKFE